MPLIKLKENIMSRKVKLQLTYGESVLISMDEAAKISAILDGKSIACTTYIGDERVEYIKDEGFVTPLSFTEPCTYCTEGEMLQKQERHRNESSLENPYANVEDVA